MTAYQAYRIATLNITSIHSALKLNSLKDFLYAADIDIILLQEVTDIALQEIYGYNAVINAGCERDLGTAILFKEGIIVKNVEKLPNNRGIACTVHNTRIVNIYAPSGSSKRRHRAEFFKYEIVPLFGVQQDEILFAGDFNCVLHRKDQFPNFNPSPELDKIIKDFTLTDAWEHKNGDAPGFTFVTNHSASRLDRIYVSNNLKTNILQTEVWPTSFTDHAAFICTINMAKQGTYRARSYWKLNVSHLNDAECRERFYKTWQECENKFTSYDSALTWWIKCAKPKIRKMFIDYSKEKSFWFKQTTEFYFQCLRDLYKPNQSVIDNYVAIKRIKSKILALKRKQLDGFQIRARTQAAAPHEETSIFHVMRERKRAQRKIFTELKGSDGSVLTTQRDIKETIYSHLSSILSGTAVDYEAQADLLQNLQGRLDREASQKLVAEIDVDDLTTAIAQSPKNKSPGPDGLPVEFYQVFQGQMKSKLLLICNELMTPDKEIAKEFLEGIVVLIPKHPSSISVKNLRPITLLNSDYKIMARILAQRLKTVMHEVTGPYQTSVGKGRSIIQTVCEYRDIIAIADVLRLPCAIMTLDFEKAFDRVDHQYLLHTMSAMGIPHNFVNIIGRILRSSTSRIMINGQLTRELAFSSSVRQGCPMSMALFAIAIEPLLATLQKRLQGLCIHGQNISCKAYADDVGLVITGESDIEIAFQVIRKYELASGARLNQTKSSILNIGAGISLRNIEDITVVTKKRILGIDYRTNIKHTIAVNSKNLLASVRACVQDHSVRKLDDIQKAAFANMYMVSKLHYVAQVLPIPGETAARILSALGHFVSRGNIFKVKFDTLTLSAENGGLKLTDVAMKSRALFVCTTYKMWKKAQHSLTSHILEEIAPETLNPPIDVSHVPNGFHHFKQFLIELSYIQTRIRATKLTKVRDVYDKLRENKSRNIVEEKYPQYDWRIIWQNISTRNLPTTVRTTWYKAVNRKIATKSKLHAIHLVDSPLCEDCSLMDNEEHRFLCNNVKEIWLLIRQMLAKITRTAPNTINTADFLNPANVPYPWTKRNAVNWLKGQTVHYILTEERKSKEDFKLYLLLQHHILMRSKNYKKHFANFLKILLCET